MKESHEFLETENLADQYYIWIESSFRNSHRFDITFFKVALT